MQRERELFELRHVRRRTERWLHAFHELSVQPSSGARDLVASWAALVVGQLSFELAGALELDPTTGEVTLALFDPVRAPDLARVPSEALAFLDGQPRGTAGAEAPPTLRALGLSLGLERFFWLCIRPGTSRVLLLVAGYSPRTAPFRALPGHDESHFLLLGNHLSTLLSRGYLMEQVNRERAELAAANAALDARLRDLHLAQQQLIESARLSAESSHRAGMAEIVTGVLHNVGNVLTSVNISVETLVESARGSRLSRLGELVRLLESPGAPLGVLLASDEAGRRLCTYLRELAGYGEGERAAFLAELRELAGHVAHLKSIIGKQQEYATACGVSERCALRALIDDAVSLARPQLGADVELYRDDEGDLELVVERHKVVQILVNLLHNAGQAIDRAPGAHRAIRITWRARPGEHLEIGVHDGGIGVRDEHRHRLFTHGFTTRPGGHGFGLHASAVAARELGGTLRFESEGPGLGASFFLEIPVTVGARRGEGAP